MLSRLTVWIVMLALVPVLQAQVEVQLMLKQKQYLAQETLELGVRVLNRSGQEVKLEGGDWLELIVMDGKEFLAKQIGPLPKPEDLTIRSSYMGSQWLDISKTFDFRENESYTVRARLKLRDWNREYFSKVRSFEIIRGASIWEQTFGVPPKNPGDAPEFRNYILQQAIYLEEPQLYLRVTDESKQKIYSVARLAPLIQVSRPETQVDSMSRLHVFTQVTVKDFAHIIVNTEGKIVQRHTYVAQGVRPAMKVSKSGSIYVAGGVRELRRSDIPTPKAFLPRAATDASLPTPDVEPPAEPEVDPIDKAEAALEKRTVESP